MEAILINQLNYKAPEKSHATEDCVGYSVLSGFHREVVENCPPWIITQRVVVIYSNIFVFMNPEDGTKKIVPKHR